MDKYTLIRFSSILQVTFLSRTIPDFLGGDFAKEVVVSYLPLSHIAAQILDIYVPINSAICVHFARPDAMRVR